MTNSTTRILALARSFPLLRFKLEGYNPKEFDAQSFMQISACWSTTERALAEFVVSVWAPFWAQDSNCAFNLAAIAGKLDDENREILAEWVRNPFYP